MKRVIAVLVFLVLTVVLVAGIFVATFNANKYRPLVVEKLEEALGRPVRIERISLGWHAGLAGQVHGLSVYEPDGKGEPVIFVESAQATVRLAPLLRRQVEITSVVLTRPEVVAWRDAQGRINLTGPAVAAAPAASAAEPPAGSTAPPMDFHVDSLTIEAGRLHWKDLQAQPPVELWVNDIDLVVRNISLNRPMDFDTRLAVAGRDRNVDARGRLLLPKGDTPGRLEELRINVQLDRLPWAEIVRLAPALQESGVQRLAGELSLMVDRVLLGSADLTRLLEGQAQLRLTNGSVALASLGAPVERISLDLAMSGMTHLALNQVSAAVAGGTVEASGAVSDFLTQPQLRLKAQVQQLALEQLLPAPKSPQEASLRGRLSLALDGTAQGQLPGHWMRTLTGQARLGLRDAAIVNLNVLREVFSRLSMLPGLVDQLLASLPPSYQEKLQARDTVLEPLDWPLQISQGSLLFDNARLATDTFQMRATGRIGFNGQLTVKPSLHIEPELSRALIERRAEFKCLLDAGGWIEIPLQTMESRLPTAPRPLPDVPLIATRLASCLAQERIGGALQRALGVEEPPAEGQPSTPAPTQPGVPQAVPPSQPPSQSQTQAPARPADPADLIGDVLKRVLTPDAEQPAQ